MTWVKIEDGLPEHPKVIRAGKLAQALFIDGLCYSARQLTNGFVPLRAAERFGYGRRLRGTVAALVAAELWEAAEGGYLIHDYLQYQPSAEQVRQGRAAKHEDKVRAGRLGAMRRWQTDSRAIADPTEEEWQTDSRAIAPSRPVPSKERAKALNNNGRVTRWKQFSDVPTDVVGRLEEAYAAQLGAGVFEQQIELALSHRNAKNYERQDLYLHNWLRRAGGDTPREKRTNSQASPGREEDPVAAFR